MEVSVDSLGTFGLARQRWTQREIADSLGVAQRTVMRWESGESPLPHRAELALSEGLRAHHEQGRFSFIDLFAGIGGTRLGWESIGGSCVFTSEWNKYATKTYLENFGEQEGHSFAGDITAVPADEVPDHDVLLAGFPCQPFSIAGVSKKNALGRAHGFADEAQGTLFFDVARIIDAKRPRAFMLENVRNLMSHDKGNTMRVIMRTLTDHLWQYLQNYAAKHRSAGNGFGFGLVGPDDVARTLSARYYKDGSEILVSRGPRRNPRRLTPRECARLMGFPDTYRIPVSDTQAYKQFGNSVVVPVVAAVARHMEPHLGLATRTVDLTDLRLTEPTLARLV
jgi:site-specific DNA-cytosine methylase